MTVVHRRMRPTDAACPECAAPAGEPCRSRHHADARLPANGSHPPRYHAAGMICLDACEDCPPYTIEIYDEWDDEDDH